MSDTEPSSDQAQLAILTHMDALPNGTRLGEFEIKGLLGVGGFGIVYRGYDHTLERPVAIKEYMPSGLVGRAANLQVTAKSNLDDKPFQAGLKSFIAEARLLAKFDHPSLVKVYRFWEANNTAYMAMPLYSGITLKQARAQMSGPPPEDWLRVVIWSVLEALKVLHNANALHRDVSPDNIFLQDVGPPVLLDLGAARLAIMDSHQKHTAVLKVNYAPIEQYSDIKELDEGPWTDLYALAAVMHGCLCNEAPLPATIRLVKDRLPALSKIAKTLQAHMGQEYSSEFTKALDHALQVQPKHRPQSVNAFAKEMRLSPVRNVHKFNWRKQLGEGTRLSGAAEPSDSAVTQPMVPPSDGKTVPFAETVMGLEAYEESSAYGALTAHDQPAGFRAWRRWGGWAAAGVVVLTLLGTVWHFASSPEPEGKVAASVTPAPVPLEVVPPAAKVSAASAESAVVPVMTAAAGAVTPAPPATQAPVASKPRSNASQQKAGVPGPARAASSPVKPGTETLAPGDKKLHSDSVVAEGAARSESSVASSEPRKTTDHKNTVLCADSGFFSKPMCIYRECQKPEYRNLQVCVEDRKKWEERDKAR